MAGVNFSLVTRQRLCDELSGDCQILEQSGDHEEQEEQGFDSDCSALRNVFTQGELNLRDLRAPRGWRLAKRLLTLDSKAGAARQRLCSHIH